METEGNNSKEVCLNCKEIEKDIDEIYEEYKQYYTTSELQQSVRYKKYEKRTYKIKFTKEQNGVRYNIHHGGIHSSISGMIKQSASH
jgi:hypothetical protein